MSTLSGSECCPLRYIAFIGMVRSASKGSRLILSVIVHLAVVIAVLPFADASFNTSACWNGNCVMQTLYNVYRADIIHELSALGAPNRHTYECKKT